MSPMTFKQKIAAYVIGLLTEKDIPDIGVTGLAEELDSVNLTIIAGLSKDENRFVMRDYLKKTLEELHLKLPDRDEATNMVVEYFCDEIIAGQIDPYEGFNQVVKIINVVDDKYQLMEAYREFIVIWETEMEGLYFYDKTKISKKDFIAETKQALVNSLKRRKKA